MSADQKAIEAHSKLYGTAAESMGLISSTANFSAHLLEAGRAFINITGKYIFFPIGVVSDVFMAIFTWQQARLSNYQSYSVDRAWVETLGALGGCIAISLFFLATFNIISLSAQVVPIIFVAIVGFKALYKLITVLRLLVQLFKKRSFAEQQAWQANLLANSVGFIILSLLTLSIGLVFIAHQFAFAVLGIVGSAIGLTFSLYNAYQSIQDQQTIAYQPLATEEDFISNAQNQLQLQPIPLSLQEEDDYPQNENPVVPSKASSTPPELSASPTFNSSYVQEIKTARKEKSSPPPSSQENSRSAEFYPERSLIYRSNKATHALSAAASISFFPRSQSFSNSDRSPITTGPTPDLSPD